MNKIRSLVDEILIPENDGFFRLFNREQDKVVRVLEAIKERIARFDANVPPDQYFSASLQESLCGLGLTYREAEVAQIVAQGLKNADVAATLHISHKTIKFHLTGIYKKLGIVRRGQLVLKCDELIKKASQA